MTAAQVVAVLRTAGFHVFGEHPAAVLAHRPVPGMAHTYRAAICQANANGSWRVGLYRQSPSGTRGRAYDYTPQVDARGRHLRHERLTDTDNMGCWLGGACSVPLGEAEIAALQRGTVAA